MISAQRDWFEERAGILEFDAGLPRAEAEKCAREMTEVHFARKAETLDALMNGRARAQWSKGGGKGRR